jgi:O-methyltransferase
VAASLKPASGLRPARAGHIKDSGRDQLTDIALPPGGRLTACDVNAESTSIARQYWKQAGVADKTDLRLASAIDTLAHLEKTGEKGPV